MTARPESVPREWSILGLLLGCFFLSGATSLVYEVVWLRMLGLIFGHTVYAVTAVLAAFMGGLALGSFVFGRRSLRIVNPVAAYGWLEIGIGVSCLALPFLLSAASAAYVALHRALELSHNTFNFVQFLVILGLLLIPTTLMGGTLPVLSQALSRRDASVGRVVGGLYTANTFGAVLGVATAGYLLLPRLGNRASILVAVVSNVGIGVLAVLYSLRRHAGQPAPAPGPIASGEAASTTSSVPRFAVWLTAGALGASGAVSMLYEVAWTRALVLVIGSSTYAFTAMLLAFLVGIAGGSALYTWLWGRRSASLATFAVIQTGIGATVLAIVFGFERTPELFLLALAWSDSPNFVQWVQVGVSAGALLLPTLLIGATFPCAATIVAGDASRLGRDVGHLYAVNTLGAIAGTVVAGFVLLPAIGAQDGIRIGVTLNLLIAGILFLVPAGPAAAYRWVGVTGALLIASGAYAVPPWDPAVMASGPAVYAKDYVQNRENLGERLRSGRILYYREGLTSTVSVHQKGAHISLRVNGKTDAGSSGDMPTQLMLGHVPMLVHPDPKAVLVIGLGSGVTAGAVSRYPVERVDVAEIEPAVLEASHFFGRWHGNVLSDPRVRAMIADGRNFLLTTSTRYDVIISEPSNPWIGGVASLFSTEFFELARQRLRPGGLMVQWLHGYHLAADDLRMVLRTFQAVFPATSIWNTIPGDYILLGRVEAAPLELELVRTRFDGNAEVRRELARIGIHAWPGVLGYFMLGESDTARLAEGAGQNTDDRLPLEFSAPRWLYRDTTQQNWQLVRRHRTAELPEVTAASRRELDRADTRYWIGAGYLWRNAIEDALAHFQRALQLDPRHTPSMAWGAAAQLKLSRPAEALALAKAALDREPKNITALVVAGFASGALRAHRDAVAFLERASSVEPQNGQIQQALTRAQLAMLRGASFGVGSDDLRGLSVGALTRSGS